MSWTAKHLIVSGSGRIISSVNTIDLLGNFAIKQTLGDENCIKSGEIEFSHRNPWPETSGQWLLIYWDGELLDAYKISAPYTEKNLKGPYKYSSQLQSVQGYFFDSLKAELVNYMDEGTGYEELGYSLSHGLSEGAAQLNIQEIAIRYGTGAYGSALDRVGFSLGDMITSLVGNGNKYFKILEINFDHCPMKWEDHIPILFRGESRDYVIATDAEKIAWTFFDYGVSWLDIFKLAIYGFNSFLRVQPIIVDNYFVVAVDFLPKIGITSYTPIKPQWKNCKRKLYEYMLDGVHLYSTINDVDNDPSFDYVQGDLDGSNVLERGVDVADKDAAIAISSEVLYWADARIYGPITPPDCGIANGYFNSGLVEPWYDKMVTDGHGYSGTIRYSGERAGDVLTAPDGKNILVNECVIKKNDGAKADIKGIAID
jgi:hypothetical protein